MTGTAAIYAKINTACPSIKERGNYFVAVDWEEYMVFSLYFSPNKTFVEFETFMNEIQVAVRRVAPRPVIMGGDFNAKNTAWGSLTSDPRGRLVEDWATELGLVLLYRGSAFTCIRPQGESIVDLSFASYTVSGSIPDLRVEEEVETLSDHFDAIRRICDACMPQVVGKYEKKQVYWWTTKIAVLRKECITARRESQQQRRRRPRNEDLENQLREIYCKAKKALKSAICRAKESAWMELTTGLDLDRWGHPYRPARGKVAQSQPIYNPCQRIV
ncbi:uncharacterized protein LOC133320789 [Danaus plexippus]|uniref:uncharacterized protein LOC133320789 n=1 Tax=Danaus plexippus TaxID=13037 RepID=UPI002AB12920|nr:uncharacterized protein LOC133320789 [Danaus plexippus]